MKPLHALELPFKLLISGFLIVLSSGFAVGELYLQHTTEMADGKPGLSMDDITFTFHGDETKTTLKKQITGPMKKYFAEGGDEKNLKPEDLADIEAVIKWNDSIAKAKEAGHPEEVEGGYWDLKKKDHTEGKTAVYKILDNHGCYDCHSAEATMKGNKKDSPLDTFVGISKFTKPDTGMDKGRLLSISHVHLLGMGMMFLLVGAAVGSTLFSRRVRSVLIVAGLSSVLLDIFGWWFVKWFGAPLAPMVMFSGALMPTVFFINVVLCFYDMWIRKVPPPKEGPVLVNHVPASVSGL